MNVGCVAEKMLDLVPGRMREKRLPQGIAALAALHDVGKVSPGFQSKCSQWLVRHGLVGRVNDLWPADHAKVSQWTVEQILGKPGLREWAAIIGAHHGKLKGRLSEEPWEDERQRLARELIDAFGPLPDKPADDAVLWFVAGLISVADWMGSDERRFPQEARWNLNERRRQAGEALRSQGWKRLSVRQPLSFQQLFPSCATANRLQEAALEVIVRPGVYVIEGPMGCGKTEAALAAAYRLLSAGQATGIYFGLPTQITSNRIHERVQPYVERISPDAEPVHLIHGSSWLMDASPPVEPGMAGPDGEAAEHAHAGRSWFASQKRAILAPFGVGTIDQALLGVVAARHFFVRQFGLAGKVVILDEVHTYDWYTGTLLDVLVKRLRELDSTVIILSATLTEERRRSLLGLDEGQPVSPRYPLVSGVDGRLVEKTCEAEGSKTVCVNSHTDRIRAEDVMSQARLGACVLWIRNTVEEAQETYRVLQGARAEGGPPVALLHSRFPYFRREQLESDWMERLGRDPARRPGGCVLVSTQVAEQSVDIDADLLVTDLAPTDMLLQRMGRLWRHERSRRPVSRPEIWIQMPPLDVAQVSALSVDELLRALGRSARVYSPYVLARTFLLWSGRPSLVLPDDIRPLLESTYADPDSESHALSELKKRLDQDREKMARTALNATAVWSIPALADEEEVQTRYGACKMAQVLLVRRIEPVDARTVRLELLDGSNVTASEGGWSLETAKALHRNIARVPRGAVKGLLANQPGWLKSQVYQPTAIGILRHDGALVGAEAGTDTGLSYHPDEGVRIRRDRVRLEPWEEDEYLD